MDIQLNDEAAEAFQSWLDESDYDDHSDLVIEALEALATKDYFAAWDRHFKTAEDEIEDLVKRIHRLRLGERIAQIDAMVAETTANSNKLAAGMNILLRPYVRRKRFFDALKFWQ